MSYVRVLYLGSDPRDPLEQAAHAYAGRTTRRFQPELIALKPTKRGKGADDVAVRDAEGSALLAGSTNCTRIALDPLGILQDSVALCTAMSRLLERGKPIAFLVGGATGLSDAVRGSADVKWSLSPLTMAHRLAVAVLCEQLYRAGEIDRGGPYHKA